MCGGKRTFTRAGALEGEIANSRAWTAAHWRFLGVFAALSVDAFTAPCSVTWRREECVKEKVAECVRGWQVCGRGIGEALLGEIGLDRSDLFV